MVFYFIH